MLVSRGSLGDDELDDMQSSDSSEKRLAETSALSARRQKILFTCLSAMRYAWPTPDGGAIDGMSYLARCHCRFADSIVSLDLLMDAANLL